MITFAHYWRGELVRLAKRLEDRQHQKRWTFLSTAALEKQVFTGSYAVRKLADSERVSPHLMREPFTVTRYPARKKEDLPEKIPHFTRRFDMLHGAPHVMTVRDLMNQFIHSYYFSPFVPSGRKMVGIFFASDAARNHCIHYITLPALAGIFRKIGSEVVSQQEMDALVEGKSIWGGKE